MPKGPIFSDQPAGGAIARCRQSVGKKTKKWDTPCVLKILCKTDKAVIDRAAKTQKIYKADRVYFDDPYFDGKKWILKRFPAAGSVGGGKIMMLSKLSCENAATTLYHEVWHTKQPAGMGWPHPSEDDAYYNTELWTISKGLPSQLYPPLRKTDSKGNIIPDKAAIKKIVDRDYPTPPPVPPGWRRLDYKKAPPQTKWYHTGTKKVVWKKSVKGETFAGPQQTTNKKQVPAKSLKCP